MSARFATCCVLVVLLALSAAGCGSGGDGSGDNTAGGEAKITAAKLQEMIASGRDDFVLIDTRSREEYESGHIPGTTANIPHDEIGERAGEVPRDKLVIVYCRTGRRSGLARDELLRLGYKNVVNFGGVKTDWPYPLEVPETVAP